MKQQTLPSCKRESHARGLSGAIPSINVLVTRDCTHLIIAVRRNYPVYAFHRTNILSKPEFSHRVGSPTGSGTAQFLELPMLHWLFDLHSVMPRTLLIRARCSPSPVPGSHSRFFACVGLLPILPFEHRSVFILSATSRNAIQGLDLSQQTVGALLLISVSLNDAILFSSNTVKVHHRPSFPWCFTFLVARLLGHVHSNGRR